MMRENKGKWNPKADPVVGFDPVLGVYTTKSGRNVTGADYTAATGKPAKKPVKTQGHPRTPNGKAGTGVDDRRGNDTRKGGLSDVQKQKMLLKYGYSFGGVDGKWGRRSEAAWNNFMSARRNGLDLDDAASYWNNNSKWGNKMNPRPDAGNAATHPDGRAQPGAPSGHGHDETFDQSSTSQDSIMQLLQSFTKLGDVSGIAQSMTNAEFDEPINKLRRDLTEHEKRSKQAQVDIENWFDSLLSESKEYDKADTAAGDKAVEGHSGLLQNILGSLGDQGAKYNVGKTALYNEAQLKGENLAHSNYNRNMMQALGLKGTEMRNDRRREDDSAYRELNGSLMDLIRGKSSKLQANTFAVQQQQSQLKSAELDRLVTSLLLPGQLEGQGLDLIGKALENAGMGSAKPNSTATLNKLQNDIWKAVVWPDKNKDGSAGKWRIPLNGKNGSHPLLQRIDSMLEGAGIQKGSPEWISIRRAILGRGGINTGPRGNPVG